MGFDGGGGGAAARDDFFGSGLFPWPKSRVAKPERPRELGGVGGLGGLGGLGLPGADESPRPDGAFSLDELLRAQGGDDEIIDAEIVGDEAGDDEAGTVRP